MTEDEIVELIDFLADVPMRELRLQGQAAAERFASRVAGKVRAGQSDDHVLFGAKIPLFLPTVFSKGEKSNLTKGECNDLGVLTKALVQEYRARVGAPRRRS